MIWECNPHSTNRRIMGTKPLDTETILTIEKTEFGSAIINNTKNCQTKNPLPSEKTIVKTSWEVNKPDWNSSEADDAHSLVTISPLFSSPRGRKHHKYQKHREATDVFTGFPGPRRCQILTNLRWVPSPTPKMPCNGLLIELAHLSVAGVMAPNMAGCRQYGQGRTIWPPAVDNKAADKMNLTYWRQTRLDQRWDDWWSRGSGERRQVMLDDTAGCSTQQG